MMLLPGDLIVRPHITLLVLDSAELWEHTNFNSGMAHERLFGIDAEVIALGDEHKMPRSTIISCWASEQVQIIRDGEILFQLPLT